MKITIRSANGDVVEIDTSEESEVVVHEAPLGTSFLPPKPTRWEDLPGYPKEEEVYKPSFNVEKPSTIPPIQDIPKLADIVELERKQNGEETRDNQ